MNWYVKVAAYKLLSGTPGGGALYRCVQKHLTHSLTPSKARLSGKIEVAAQYLSWLAEHQETERLLKGVHVDFGSGWHPTIPLFLYSAGVERQYLFDVAPLLDADLVAQTTSTFLSIVDQPDFPHRRLLRRRPPLFEGGDWRKYLDSLGLSYCAPYGEALKRLASGVDVVSCTQALLHIPRPILVRCFEGIHASLKPGGLFFATIHLRDILAGIFQQGLVKYNQLKFSPGTWDRWMQSSLMSFNRLKAPDYRELLEAAGFEIIHFEVEPGTADDVKELDQVRIAECFRQYSREDLAAKHLFVVARRR